MNIFQSVRIIAGAVTKEQDKKRKPKLEHHKNIRQLSYEMSQKSDIRGALDQAMQLLQKQNTTIISLDDESVIFLSEVLAEQTYREAIKAIQDPAVSTRFTVIKVGDGIW